MQITNQSKNEMKNSDYSAFPLNENAPHDGIGLTKREYFAGLAMRGILTSTTDEPNFDVIAKWSIEQADELLKQLESK